MSADKKSTKKHPKKIPWTYCKKEIFGSNLIKKNKDQKRDFMINFEDMPEDFKGT